MVIYCISELLYKSSDLAHLIKVRFLCLRYKHYDMIRIEVGVDKKGHREKAEYYLPFFVFMDEGILLSDKSPGQMFMINLWYLPKLLSYKISNMCDHSYLCLFKSSRGPETA